MEYATLGRSGLKISRISLGCMSLPLDEQTAFTILGEALDNGVNFFDTADIYNDGQNEVLVGKALQRVRDKIFIASKAGNVRRQDGGLDWNPSKQHILQSIEGSLKRLNTDYLDLYMLHGGTIDDNISETISAFEEIRQSGKIRFYGISSIRPNVIQEYVNRSAITSVMMQYSLLDRRPEETCLSLLQRNNIGVLARGSVAQGLLINKPAKTYLAHDANDVAKAASAVHSITNSERTATHVALKYTLQNPAITSAVVGVRTPEQLKDVLKTFNRSDLSSDELSMLRNAASPIVYEQHRT